ncbi:MAG: hypothetical protein HN501_02400, partial [Waddliaceae bacterium]|nr:hypothetical protein [Waddliaceae bacterium]
MLGPKIFSSEENRDGNIIPKQDATSKEKIKGHTVHHTSEDDLPNSIFNVGESRESEKPLTGRQIKRIIKDIKDGSVTAKISTPDILTKITHIKLVQSLAQGIRTGAPNKKVYVDSLLDILRKESSSEDHAKLIKAIKDLFAEGLPPEDQKRFVRPLCDLAEQVSTEKSDVVFQLSKALTVAIASKNVPAKDKKDLVKSFKAVI